MAQKTFNRQLPTTGAGVPYNLFDQVVGAIGYTVGPAWSPGAQLVVEPPQQEFPRPCSILGYGFTFMGSLYNIPVTLNGYQCPTFARLGKLYGGLMKNSGAPIGSGAFATVPEDRTMIDLLWNGQDDPPWPQARAQTPFAPGPFSLQAFKESLAQPVELASDDTLTVGLWLTPMLGQNVGIWITSGAYSILYDDPNR